MQRIAAPAIVPASGCAPPIPPRAALEPGDPRPALPPGRGRPPPHPAEPGGEDRAPAQISAAEVLLARRRERLVRPLEDPLRADVDPRPGGHLTEHRQPHRF